MSAKLFFLWVALGLALSASAKIELHSLFGNNMILQRDANNSLWGWAQPGASVEVKASWGSIARTKADEKGKWVVLLNTPGPGTGHGLSISSGRDVVKIKNVAVGEVWLCAGQSNMGFALGMMFTGEDLRRQIGIPLRIRDLGGREEQLPGFAMKAHALDRLTGVNPRKVTVKDLEQILRDAF